MRFDTIKQWKYVNSLNESIDDSLNINRLTDDVIKSIDDIVKVAISEGLPKKQTLEYVKNVYIDADKAPESVNVSIFRDNIIEILVVLDDIKNWPNEEEYLKVIKNIKNEDDLVFKDKTGKIEILSKNKLYDNDQFEYLKSIDAQLLYNNVKWIKQILK